MFSSNPSSSISINPNANPSSSSYLHCAPLFSGYENNNGVLLNHHHHHHHHHQLDPLTTGCFLPAAAANHQSLTNTAFTGVSNNTAVMMMNNAGYYDDDNDDDASNFIRIRKTTLRRDRHSKICTAQGLRDRRVRLSIDIAREFFDLQDMLGFDKASKTLEWLLNKSRTAIKELAELKKNTSNNNGVLEEAAAVTVTGLRSKQMEEGNSEERKIMEKLTKKSRDKARARARQRTREKLCKKIADTSSRQILTQIRTLSSQIKANCEESSSYVVAHAHQVQEPSSHTLANRAPMERKQNPYSYFANEQQNHEISRDIMSCNTTSSYGFNLPQNRDIISAMPHQYSTFRAITKHESFKW